MSMNLYRRWISEGGSTRRQWLRGTGVALALPWLEALRPRSARGAAAEAPRRMVTICGTLGIHAPFFIPEKPGADFQLTPYLQKIKQHRAQFTVISGLSHGEQSGLNGHANEMTWLTSAKHPGMTGFRNTISVDQVAANAVGDATRFPSLVLSTGSGGQSYTSTGVMIPADNKPSKIFAKLFLEGSATEIKNQKQQLRDGRTIMDAVHDEAKALQRRLGPGDRDKLDEYFGAVRDMEQRLAKSESWTDRPKPKPDVKPPQDVTNESDVIAKMQLLLQLASLAFQTDSTRVISVTIHGANSVPPVPGVTIDHHNLSHHGQEPEKIDQLRKVEEAHFDALNTFLSDLAGKSEAGGTLLDRTAVLFGSNLGNANAHDWRNLPLLLAGGGFKHGQHLAFDPKNNAPFCNLFVSMLQRLGLETGSFGASTGRLTGLEFA